LKNKSKLLEIVLIFLKLGTIGFGGPTALIALMETEMVHKRKWVSHEYFMDMLAATNLVPGPNAVEMAIHLGQIRAGFLGLLLAGFSFLLPPTVITLVLAILYVRWGSLPQITQIFYGISPVVISIILFSGIRIGKSALNSATTVCLALICVVASLLNIDEAVIILSSGLISVLIYIFRTNKITPVLFLLSFTVNFITVCSFVNSKLANLGLYFLKIGFILFGSGLVLFAYIHNDLVNNFQWLTERQLLDAIAVGQFTPGPVSSSVTFIGYLIAGIPGAIISTLGIFFPSFIIVTILGKILPKIRKSQIVQIFLNGVNAAVVALIISVTISLFKSSISDYLTLAIFFSSLFIIWKYKIDPIWLILSGAIIGLMKYVFILQ